MRSILVSSFVLCLFPVLLVAQIIPSPQSLPYQQNFSGLLHSSTSYPSGWVGWTVATSVGSFFNTSAPIADRALIANSSASTSTGNVHNYNGKIGMLNTGSLDLALALSLNTLDKANILLRFDAMTIRNPFDSLSNNRIRALGLQYRTDTSGPFKNIPGFEYRNNGVRQTGSGITAPQNLISYSIVLPAECDSQSKLQLRWVSRDVSGAGLRPSFAIGNISVDTASVMFLQVVNNAYEELAASPAHIKVRLSSPLKSSRSFHYSFLGSASFAIDYTAQIETSTASRLITANAGTLSLDSGTSEFFILLTPINDTLVEGLENIRFVVEEAFDAYALKDSAVLLSIIDDEPTPIHMIQGKSLHAQKGEYKIEAVVTGVYPKMSPPGFFIQEEDADADISRQSSEALYVVTDSMPDIGDKIWLSADVVEHDSFPSYRQCVALPKSILIKSKGNPLPKATLIKLPVDSLSVWEQYEGMLLQFEDTLLVSDNEFLGRFGELTLSAGSLVYQPTQIVDPNDAIASGTSASGASNVGAINQYLSNRQLHSIVLDDGQSGSLTSIPFINKENTVRVGSRIASLSGILAYAFDAYRLFPQRLSDVKIEHAPRPLTPSWGDAAELKIASFNVLNYFNGDGLGAGFPTSRGASSLAEFVRQRDKIIKAIVTLNADILGLIEIENDGTQFGSAIQNLVDGINAYKGAGAYAFVLDGDLKQENNIDEIKCAIIYKTAVVDTLGSAILSADTIFDRPPLAQHFRVKSSDSVFCFLINHFKSKSCTESRGRDRDQNDGQSCFNDKRKKQADALLRFIKDSLGAVYKTDKVISLGDYNAYFEEDPLDTIRSSGYVVLGDPYSYSYLYKGQLGALDNAIVSASLLPFVQHYAKWNINSVEPPFLGYEDDVLDTLGDETNFWSYLYADDVFRCSDHDPVLVSLALGPNLSILSKQMARAQMTLFPNPAYTSVTCIIPSKQRGASHWSVVNSIGQTIMIGEAAAPMLTIDVSKLAAGQYWIRCWNEKDVYVQSFLKK